jgi:hypothetical protein
MAEKVTIRFIVGGKLYEVSRSSLIEQQHDTMLTRLVSETWQNEESSNEAIFIDRDGERFAFVLDYLRYGQVQLPATMSKDALMKDMDYYGILADGGKILVSNYGIARLKELNQELKCLTKEKEHIIFVMTCLKKYIDRIDQYSGKATVSIVPRRKRKVTSNWLLTLSCSIIALLFKV